MGSKSSVAVIPKMFGTFSCLLPLFLKHLFKVWKMLIFFFWELPYRDESHGHIPIHTISATCGDHSPNRTCGNVLIQLSFLFALMSILDDYSVTPFS